MKNKLGKITHVVFGLGGYNDAELGIHLQFRGKGWGVGKSKCVYDYQRIEHTEHCKWTEQDRAAQFIELMRFISKLLKSANVSSVDKLKGIPVECSFDGMTLKDWRILEEVL